MLTPILMAASGTITLCAVYVAWHYAKQAQRAAELLALARSERNEAIGEIDRLSDLVAKYQRKQPEREANGKFASKKKRVLKELQDYVASK